MSTLTFQDKIRSPANTQEIEFMTQVQSTDQASRRIEESLERMREELPQMAGLIDAFKELFVEQAVFRAELPRMDCSEISIDPVKYVQGIPILGKEAFAVPQESLKVAGMRLIPTMEKGFPNIIEQLKVVSRLLGGPDPWPADFVGAIQLNDDHGIEKLGERLNIEPEILKFVFVQLSRPFALKRAESMPTLPEHLHWTKGYCPLCGSWPELSFLEGKEGYRRLRCSFCGHEWNFMRTQCPFCENTDQEKLEFIFSEDRDFERAELCYECMKYIMSIDLRNRAGEIPREIAALGLVYLDVLAQERNFSPGAGCTWNVL